MDQVRAIALKVWEQRFWVLSVIAMSAIVVCWNTASSDLEKRFSSRISAISGQFNKVRGISNEPFHPNDKVTEADRAQAVIQSKSVYKIWSDLYNLQHNTVLNWPVDLGEEFIEKMEGRKFLDPIDQEMRSIYGELIENQFENLRGIVKARKSGLGNRASTRSRFDREGRPGGAAPEPKEEEEDYLVEWLDQGDLQARLSFESMPTHEQIWVTQEDLWVYETLLNIIAKTNEQKNATRPDNTAIRTITRLEVGSLAVETSTPPAEIFIPQQGEGGVGLGRVGREAPPPRGAAEGGGSRDGSAAPSPLENRYIDPNGNAVSGASLAAEYRQLPIHMVLEIDQRYLPQLLIECANAPLPIDVKWVRVNPEKARNVTNERAVGNTRDSSSTPDVNLATVEMQCALLIYGEPNRQILSVPGAEEELAEEDVNAETEDVAATPVDSTS